MFQVGRLDRYEEEEIADDILILDYHSWDDFTDHHSSKLITPSLFLSIFAKKFSKFELVTDSPAR